MKALLLACTSLILLLLGAAPARAATYVDDFRDIRGYGARDSEEGLMRNAAGQMTVRPGQSRLRGGMLYHVRDAELVTLWVYSAKGTYVMEDATGAPTLGMDSGVFHPELSRLQSARVNPADGKLYTSHRGGWYVLEPGGNGSYAAFLPAPAFGGQGLADYGATLYAVTPGGRERLPLTRADSPADTLPGGVNFLEADGGIVCAEVLVCHPPDDATGFYVELNDINYGVTGRGAVPVSLARVEIQGEFITVGPEVSAAAPPSQSNGEPSGSSEPPEPSGSSGASGLSSVPGPSSSSRASSSSKPALKPASSKFTGVVTAPPPKAPRAPAASPSARPAASSRRAASSSSPRSSGRSASPPSDEASLRVSSSAPPETAPTSPPSRPPPVYDIYRESTGAGPLDVGMLIYLVAVAAVILYLLLKKK